MELIVLGGRCLGGGTKSSTNCIAMNTTAKSGNNLETSGVKTI